MSKKEAFFTERRETVKKSVSFLLEAASVCGLVMQCYLLKSKVIFELHQLKTVLSFKFVLLDHR